ncbi:MAG TPA: protein-L-isoaspartate O-methyltransferase [Gammaproteobacteria bacterium]
MPTAAAENIDFAMLREHMVERQVRTWDVLDPTVLDVMRALPRDRFVPAEFRALAYADAQIPLPHGEKMMHPKVEGRLLQALGIRATDSILEIGTGTGWVTALLAHLVHGGGGSVHSVDIHEEFTRGAKRALDALNIANVRLETRDAATLGGFSDGYDCIAVTGSMPAVHESFRRKLKVGGRLFAIVGGQPIMEAQLHTRISENDWAVDSLFDTEIPALVNAWNPGRFEF